MNEFQWDMEMNIGVAEIDEQHEYLTGVLNTLCQSFAQGTDKEILEETISQINDYGRYHFETEERYMRQFENEYPDYIAHLEAHQEFFEKVVSFLLDYVEGKDSITIELLNYLVDWWFQHINGMDKGLGKFLQQKGVAEA